MEQYIFEFSWKIEGAAEKGYKFYVPVSSHKVRPAPKTFHFLNNKMSFQYYNYDRFDTIADSSIFFLHKFILFTLLEVPSKSFYKN
jgi:hypothetical protein